MTKIQEIVQLANGPYGTNCYLLSTKGGVSIIDAPYPAFSIIEQIEKMGELKNIYLTHGHFDHVLALPELKAKYPACKIYLNEKDNHYFINEGQDMLEQVASFDPFFASRYASNITKLPSVDYFYSNLDVTEEGFTILELPGHTDGSIGLYSKALNLIFSGDTLFKQGVGRTDLGGNEKILLQSLSKLKSLPPSTVVYPGHGEKTNLGEEL